MRAAALCVMLFAYVAFPTSVGAEAPAALEPLAFLLGSWDGAGGGGPGQGAGVAVFSRGLQDQVILRSSFAEYPASEKGPASRHDDLMVIYPASGSGIAADYYDSEGHRIHYTVTTPASDEAIFVSDVVAGAPRFRLTYKSGPEDRLQGEFAIAPPDKPEAFARYLAWESTRSRTEAPATGK